MQGGCVAWRAGWAGPGGPLIAPIASAACSDQAAIKGTRSQQSFCNYAQPSPARSAGDSGMAAIH